jgi:hypothetical protein
MCLFSNIWYSEKGSNLGSWPLHLATMAQGLMLIGRRHLEGCDRHLLLSINADTLVDLGMIKALPRCGW